MILHRLRPFAIVAFFGCAVTSQAPRPQPTPPTTRSYEFYVPANPVKADAATITRMAYIVITSNSFEELGSVESTGQVRVSSKVARFCDLRRFKRDLQLAAWSTGRAQLAANRRLMACARKVR